MVGYRGSAILSPRKHFPGTPLPTESKSCCPRGLFITTPQPGLSQFLLLIQVSEFIHKPDLSPGLHQQ